MKQKLKSGQLVKIKSDVVEIMIEHGFDKDVAERFESMAGEEFTIDLLFSQDGIEWAILDEHLCIELPYYCFDPVYYPQNLN